MTVLTATFDTIALGADCGSLEFYCDPVRTGSAGTSFITPTPLIVPITSGSLTTPNLDPGIAQVRTNIGNWRETYTILIPATGPVNLLTLLGAYAKPVPSSVSSAFTAEQGAQSAMSTALYYATSAASSASAAAASAAVAEGVAGVGPATTTVAGLIQLAGDLSGTATAPTVPGLTVKAPLASPVFTGGITTPAVKVTTSPSAGAVFTSDSSGNGTWQAPSAAPNATSGVPGLVQLAGQLGGTYSAPTVPLLATLAPINSPVFIGTSTHPSIVIEAGTPGVGNVLTSDSAGYGTWQPLPTNVQAAAMAFVLG